MSDYTVPGSSLSVIYYCFVVLSTVMQQSSQSDITIEELTDPDGRFMKRSIDVSIP